MIMLKAISDEVFVLILTYLRAADLVSAREVDKTVFSCKRISDAIEFQLVAMYGMSNKPATMQFDLLRPDILFIREVQCILSALSSPQPVNGKGYWISSSWLSNAKKYFEAINLPEVGENTKKSGKRKQSKIRQRRGSDALPPWPSMTADIVCSHGELALTKGLRGKKRLIDKRNWHFLRRLYPDGPQFKSTCSYDCTICLNGEQTAKNDAAERREAEIISRRNDLLSEKLIPLFNRKCGIPVHCIASRVAMYTDRFDDDAGVNEMLDSLEYSSPNSPNGFPSEPNSMISASGMPLIAGLYNLVPRTWLKAWRRFTKDPSMVALMQLDCSSLICHSHGLLVVPPHLEEYLVGLRRSLVGGLGNYSGEVIEIVSIEEWDEIQKMLHSNDVGIRFAVDGETSAIAWNVGLCRVCDPFNYSQLHHPSRCRYEGSRFIPIAAQLR